MGLYTSCDIALISPLRDGMNLVAKEFIASRQDQQGVLLLSDMTGAAKELTESLLFNPLDGIEIAQKIAIALAMPPEEQKNRMAASQNQIKIHNVFKWANNFVEDLQSITKHKKTTLPLEYNAKIDLITQYQKANKRLILLDYDGTLVDFHAQPHLAFPPEPVLELLQQLSQNPKNQIAIVSGRDRDTLDKWLGHLPIILIAEHGAYTKTETWQANIKHRQTWKDGVKNIMQTFADNCHGAFVEEKKYALCWHYRNTDKESGFAQSRELISVLSDYLISTNANIIDGNKVIEVKPVQINKGVIVEQTFDLKNYDFCLAMGDDKTDEDMFETINQYKGMTIKVGKASSMATFRLETIQQVFSFLELLK
jgi:trehalose 6-phosphate synthase/phosphatase